MAEIIKPDMTALWASGGAVVAPTTNKINEGWTAEIPPHQWENFVQLRQDEAIAYLFQRGIAEWDNTTEYFANKSVVLYNGSLYIAIVNNQNTTPTNTTRWKPITGNATTSTAGLMTPEDKLKIDGIEAGAQKNVVLSVAGKVGSVSLSKADVGLSNVDNTTDAQKPLSNAAINALNTKAPINSPTFTGTVSGITKGMVGLSNVDNTSDLSKPISTATQTALNSKANTHNPTFTGTVSGITKGMVGLGNVDNTSDLNKPISTATQAAIDAINTNTSSKANTSTQIIAGTGLSGGGTLAANRTLSVNYGTAAGTAAQGNDSRITGAAQQSSNLSDLTNTATARSNLGLGSAATRNVGTGSGNLMEVGAFGLGVVGVNLNLENKSYLANFGPDTLPTNYPEGEYEYGALLSLAHGYYGTNTDMVFTHSLDSKILYRFSRSGPWNEIYHSGRSIPWSKITGAPATATRWPSWSEVSSKPSTFSPSSHNHSADNITSGTLNGARMPMGAGGVGTYAFVIPPARELHTTELNYAWNTTTSGANLRTSGSSNTRGDALSGTWRILGQSAYSRTFYQSSTTYYDNRATLAVRIS